MNTSELLNRIMKKKNFSEQEVKELLERLIESFISVLKRDKRIEIRKFGIFELKKRAPKKGRVIKTGEYVYIPQRYVPAFHSGTVLYKLLNPEMLTKKTAEDKVYDINIKGE